MELFIFARFHAREGGEAGVAAAVRAVVVPTRAGPAAWRSTPSARFAIHASFISTRAGSTKRPSTSTPNCRTP